MSNATVDALGMCFSHIPLLVWLIATSDKSYIRIGKSVHISARASTVALLMTILEVCEVSISGTSNEEIPRFPLFYSLTLG